MSAPAGSARSTTPQGVDFAQRGQLLTDTLARVQGAVARDARRARRRRRSRSDDDLLRAQAVAAGRRADVDRGHAARPQPRAPRATTATAGSRSWARRSRASPRARDGSARRGAPPGAIPPTCRCRRRCACERDDDGRPDLARSMATGARARRRGRDRHHRDVARVRARPAPTTPAVTRRIAGASTRRVSQEYGLTVLTPFDDYPIHQTSLPVAHPAIGDPNHYDRFWFNGYTEDFYFAAGMAVYPNRGIIDAAFAVVHDGVQRSVFASGRIPIDRGETRIGPLTIEVVEPLRVTRVVADAADLGIDADVTFTDAHRSRSRSRARRSPRARRRCMDSTRMTQWGHWSGRITTGGSRRRDRAHATAPRTGRGGCAQSARRRRRAPEIDVAADLLPVGADQLGRLLHALPLLRARQRRPVGRAARPCST